ncbi:MAG: lysophospholipid acyltransferase family protein [Bacilli bacterium]|jgi:hypothetical protein|nr:1-acyl-sn-glycerol-3-phosphate acyltransferase [Staphylococcus sp.]
MILSILFWIISIISAILIYFCTSLSSHWYLFLIPIILVPLLYLLCFLIYILILYIWSLFLNTKKDIKKPHNLYYFFVEQTNYLIIKLSRTKVIINGLNKLPSDKHFLVISNHLSNFDPMLIIYSLKKHPMICITKKENEKLPICGKFIYNAGFISLDRSDAHQAVKAIKKATDFITNDWSNIHICPEGTRSKSGELLEFHPGSFKIAMKAKSPIVVCCLQNTNHIHKNSPWKKTYVNLDILDTLDYQDYENLNSTELSTKVRNMISDYQTKK